MRNPPICRLADSGGSTEWMWCIHNRSSIFITVVRVIGVNIYWNYSSTKLVCMPLPNHIRLPFQLHFVHDITKVLSNYGSTPTWTLTEIADPHWITFNKVTWCCVTVVIYLLLFFPVESISLARV